MVNDNTMKELAQNWRIWRTDNRARLTIELSRRAMEVDWIADTYWSRKSKRSPVKTKFARQAMRNRAVSDYYWLWRKERVNRLADARENNDARVG